MSSLICTTTPLEEMLGESEHSFVSVVSSTSSAEGSSPIDESTELSSQYYSFTPRRAKFLPRAWERKPSTPYAPRNEAQKIWKRMPLQKSGANVADGWKAVSLRHHAITRPVKRLRLTMPRKESDKENVNYIGVKWETALSPSTSPRRRRPYVNSSTIYKSVMEPVDAAILEGDIADSEVEYEHYSVEHNRIEEQNIVINKEPEFVDPQRGDHYDTSREVSPSSQAQASFVETPPQSVDVSREGNDELHATLECSSMNTDITLQCENQSSEQLDEKEHGHDCPTVNQREAPMNEFHTAQNQNREEHSTSTTAQDRTSPTSLGSTTPTSINLLFNHLPRIEPDDTSYLHDFLSRARAQKAAKLQPSPDLIPTTPSSPKSASDLHSPNQQASDQSASVEAVDHDRESTPPPNPDDQVEGEINASSPCRRSSRLTTKLPRPQKPATTLPSNIPLKRLNGTEFISMQREAHSLAFTTRTNTRKNKAEAIPVPLKLMQLHTEGWFDGKADDKLKRKQRKAVAWAEILAKFQSEDGTEIAMAARSRSELPQKATTTQVPDGDQEQKQARKVKKIRKASVGNVNGTPAPKRSLDVMKLEHDAKLTGPDAETLQKKHRTRVKI